MHQPEQRLPYSYCPLRNQPIAVFRHRVEDAPVSGAFEHFTCHSCRIVQESLERAHDRLHLCYADSILLAIFWTVK